MATRRDDARHEIDAAELARVFAVTPETGMATGNAMHHAIPVRDTGATPHPDLEMVKRFAGYGAELAGLKALCAGDVLNLVISDRRARRAPSIQH
jgi:hypothetical protein